MKMEEDSDPLKCTVCKESYDSKEHSPRMLICSHTFCSFCIGQLISNGTRNCPVCRQRFNARSKEDIAMNRALLDVVDMCTKKRNFPSNSGESKGSSFEVWQKSFSKDLKEGGFAVCTKEKAFAEETMKRKQELKTRFKESSDKINDKLIPALSEISRKFKTNIRKIDEEYQFLETKFGTFTKEEEELGRMESNVKASKSFASVDSYVSITGEIDKRLEALTTELKDFTTKDKSEHPKMLKELEDVERKLAVVEDILSHENQEEEDTSHATRMTAQHMWRPRTGQREGGTCPRAPQGPMPLAAFFAGPTNVSSHSDSRNQERYRRENRAGAPRERNMSFNWLPPRQLRGTTIAANFDDDDDDSDEHWHFG